jgi:hypothetical protein
MGIENDIKEEFKELDAATGKMVKNFREAGNVLMLVGINSLFVWMAIEFGAYVPIAALLFGAGFVFVAKIIKLLTPKLAGN